MADDHAMSMSMSLAPPISPDYDDYLDDDDDDDDSFDLEPQPQQQQQNTSAVTVAIPTPPPPHPHPHPPPPAAIPDSRKLFQRLWTDDDEIEILQGFLDYTTSRCVSGHHYDTTAFYDSIKNKFHLDFNKSQLVEKLRRLKKKYRTALSKMSSSNNATNAKEFVFKSPHDYATFQISRKIWFNLPGTANSLDFDDDDYSPAPIPNPNPNPNPNASYSYAPRTINVSPGIGGFDMVLANSSGGGGGGLAKLSTRKRPREERISITNSDGNGNGYGNGEGASMSAPLKGLIEETIRNCLSPVLKDLIKNAVGSGDVGGLNEGGSPGVKVVEALPLSSAGVNEGGAGGDVGGKMDAKWRKQQILELEVYAKRLELVQDQIKLSLEELRSMESHE